MERTFSLSIFFYRLLFKIRNFVIIFAQTKANLSARRSFKQKLEGENYETRRLQEYFERSFDTCHREKKI